MKKLSISAEVLSEMEALQVKGGTANTNDTNNGCNPACTGTNTNCPSCTSNDDCPCTHIPVDIACMTNTDCLNCKIDVFCQICLA